MKIDRSTPLSATVGDWDPFPTYPLQILNCDRYRDGGPQGGSGALVISDAEGRKYHFFFDSFLGRLCHGRDFEHGDDAAFIEKGSRLEKALFEFLETQIGHPVFGEELRARINVARAYIE